MLSKKQRLLKRSFDVTFSIVGIILCSLPILLLIVIATISTKKFGIFKQERIGKNGKPFFMYKIRTMRKGDIDNHITLINDPRITKTGYFLRKTRLDELPQLFNIVKGDMSFVGPRPDIKGYADLLDGEDRIILSVRPGLTGPATLRFRDEDALLNNVVDPQEYNDAVIWPQKVAINKQYIENWSFYKDIKYIILSIFPNFDNF
ncbi:MAG: sugar transferase [Flavobacteriaceae bacterium]|nr:sugar transferase [Flavobacteriaceae bacterium]